MVKRVGLVAISKLGYRVRLKMWIKRHLPSSLYDTMKRWYYLLRGTLTKRRVRE